MKNIQPKTKQGIQKIPRSKLNKISLDSLSFSTRKIKCINKNDNSQKEWQIDERTSFGEIQSNNLNTDSLNNTKTTLLKTSPINPSDNKLVQLSTSCSMQEKNKSFSFKNEKNSLIDNDFRIEDIINTEDTQKIDYRYYQHYLVKDIEFYKKSKDKIYLWFAAYDKLMNKKKIYKILDYYGDSDENIKNVVKDEINTDNKYNFKEKAMIINDYEIYFLKNYNKPFIRFNKNKKIFIKLYLLSLEQINKIFSYINRYQYREYLNEEKIININEKNSSFCIGQFSKTKYNYSQIYCLGSYMNINIYTFTHWLKNEKQYNIHNASNLPKAKYLAKLIKIYMLNFPEYSKQYFISYLMQSDNNDKNSSQMYNMINVNILKKKMDEVNQLLISKNRKIFQNLHENLSTKEVIRNTIIGIPTNTPTPEKFNNTSNVLASVNNTNSNIKNNDVNNNSSIFFSDVQKEIENKKKQGLNQKSFVEIFDIEPDKSKDINRNNTIKLLNDIKRNSINYKNKNNDYTSKDNSNRIKSSNSLQKLSIKNTCILNITKNTDNKTNLLLENNSLKDNIVTISGIVANSVKKTLDSNLFSISKSSNNKGDNNFNTFVNNTFHGYENDNSESIDHKIEIENICPSNQMTQTNKTNNYHNKKCSNISVYQNYNTNVDTNNNNEILSDKKKTAFRNSFKINSFIYDNESNEINAKRNSFNNTKYKIENIKHVFKNKNDTKYKNDNTRNDYNSCNNIFKYDKKRLSSSSSGIGFNSKNDKLNYITPRKNKLFYYYH